MREVCTANFGTRFEKIYIAIKKFINGIEIEKIRPLLWYKLIIIIMEKCLIRNNLEYINIFSK